MPDLLPTTLLPALIRAVQNYESTYSKRNISKNLDNSDVTIWYLDENEEIDFQVRELASNSHRAFLHDSADGSQLTRIFDAIKTFDELVSKNKIPSTMTYLKFEPGKVQGCIDHRDVDSVFSTGLLYLRDTTRGQLDVEKHDLPQFFSPGDFLVIDPRRINSVPNFAGEKYLKYFCSPCNKI